MVATDLKELFLSVEANRARVSLDTGSLMLGDAFRLHELVKGYPVKRAAEWGTYIGRSALAIGTAMDGVVYTCDGKNDAFSSPGFGIICHPFTSSTEMLRGIDGKLDLFFFDGFILPDDVAEIKRLSHPRTVYVFDDYKAKMKGTKNVPLLEPFLRDSHEFRMQGERMASFIPKP